MNVNLTADEWRRVLDAVEREPNPEGFDFGPAYEAAKRENAELAKRIRSQLRVQFFR